MIRLRTVTSEDESLLLRWANDPSVRQMAFNSTEISAEGHKKWFHSKLNDLKSCIYILEDFDTPLGQIRFDFSEEDQSFYIDYSIDQNSRGRGYGNFILSEGMELHRKQNIEGRKYKALVKENNGASIQCFTKCGFRQISKSPGVIVFVKD